MAEQIKQKWSLASVRTACAVIAVCLHAWAVSAPMAVEAVTKAAAQAHSAMANKRELAFSLMTVASPAAPMVETARSEVKPSAPVVKPSAPVVQHKQPAPKANASMTGDATDLAPAVTSPAPSEAGVHPLAEMSKPTFLSPPSPPIYPALARKRGQEGTVWLDIVLDAQGTQAQLHILKSSGVAMLDTAALSAVSRWRFRPYEVSGVGRPSRVRIPIEFSLN